jgi:hypothetical protein
MTSTLATPVSRSPRSTLVDSVAEENAPAEANGSWRYGGWLLRQPLILCALVLMVALMGSYVQVLVGQVEHGEQLRKGNIKWAQQPAGVAGQLSVDASQTPMLPVRMGTGR